MKRNVLWLAFVLLLSAGACRKSERLLLLDVRASGGLPTTVSAVRFSAMDWPTHSLAGVLGTSGLLFGYYGPGGSGPVTVTAEAIDASNCVLGTGSATVLDTSSGQTAPPTILYVRPLPDTTCVLPDAGVDADSGGAEAGADGPDADADADAASSDGGDAEAGADTRADGGTDAAVDHGGDGASASDASDASDGAGADALDALDATPG